METLKFDISILNYKTFKILQIQIRNAIKIKFFKQWALKTKIETEPRTEHFQNQSHKSKRIIIFRS